MLDTLDKNIVHSHQSIAEALQKLNENPPGMTLFVLNELDKVVGTITDGDIRRGLLKNVNMTDKVEVLMNNDFKYLSEEHLVFQEIKIYRKQGIKVIPYLNKRGKLIRILDLTKIKGILPIEAIIMAGGKGERLKPLTEKTPKPLLKVGDKPIIEHNIKRLINYGISRVHISINYLAEQIVQYFKSNESPEIDIRYIYENKPLGTIGGLGLVENFEQNTILVLNSDILSNIDYDDFYQTFIDSEADLCVATIPYSVNIPYAILLTNKDQVNSLEEKPTYTYQASAGIYLLKKEIVYLLPKDTRFDAPDFINLLLKMNKKVTHYTIVDYWLDIGNLSDYQKAQEDIKHLKLL